MKQLLTKINNTETKITEIKQLIRRLKFQREILKKAGSTKQITPVMIITRKIEAQQRTLKIHRIILAETIFQYYKIQPHSL